MGAAWKRHQAGNAMTGQEANRVLRRTASILLRRSGNDPDRALPAFKQYLLDDATQGAILDAFIGATTAYADPGHDMFKDARAYLVKLAHSMPRAVN
jgi:hypothetical protein